jgi:hypothetical protein
VLADEFAETDMELLDFEEGKKDGSEEGREDARSR